MHYKPILFAVILLIAGALLIAGCTSVPQDSTPAGTVAETPAPGAAERSILVYSGAGLKAPMQEIGQLFRQKYGTNVQYTYGGSGMLISQMNLVRKGDVFIPGSTVEYAIAQKQGLVGSSLLVAYHVPVIAVQKGNPYHIQSIRDFAQPGLKIALGDANATAIGKAGTKMFNNYNITDAVEKNVVTRTPTINELTILMNTGQADASLLTLDQINEDTMEAVSIPVSENVVLIVPVGLTTFTENTKNAQEFMDFVTSEDGKAVFVKHGFPAYPDPHYAGVQQ